MQGIWNNSTTTTLARHLPVVVGVGLLGVAAACGSSPAGPSPLEELPTEFRGQVITHHPDTIEPIPDVRVTAVESGSVVETDAQGFFTFPGVSRPFMWLGFEKPGFETRPRVRVERLEADTIHYYAGELIESPLTKLGHEWPPAVVPFMSRFQLPDELSLYLWADDADVPNPFSHGCGVVRAKRRVRGTANPEHRQAINGIIHELVHAEQGVESGDRRRGCIDHDAWNRTEKAVDYMAAARADYELRGHWPPRAGGPEVSGWPWIEGAADQVDWYLCALSRYSYDRFAEVRPNSFDWAEKYWGPRPRFSACPLD